MHTMRCVAWVLSLLLLTGCGGKQGDGDDAQREASATAPAAPAALVRAAPDFGGVTTSTVDAEGVGATQNDAVLRALDAAITQVNGRRVASAARSSSTTLAIDVNGVRQMDVHSGAYAERIVSSSRGAVRSFKVLASEEVSQLDGEREMHANASSGGWLDRSAFEVNSTERTYSRYWKARVQADVARFEGPKDDGRPSLVVTVPRQAERSYAVGDERVPAAAVAAEIRRRLVEAIAQSQRFVVLEREFSAEMQQEVDFINSDNARSDAVARLGQQLAADLILVPSVERFEYPRAVRQLRMSDRELVSYSGGGRIGLRLLNAATGEVVLARTFDHELPATAPSTLPRVIDGTLVTNELMDALSDQMVRAITGKVFPVSVVALSGRQAVLSQGGQAVRVGEDFEVMVLGLELTDPQTGRSLGRMESPCCRLHVDRVADRTSYGTLTGELPPELAHFTPGMLELGEPLAFAAPESAGIEAASRHTVAAAAAPAAATKAHKPAPSEPVAADHDDSDAGW